MKKRWAILILAIAVFGSYAPVVRDGFVWDDTALVLRDPLIRSWRLIPEGFQHFLFTDATASDFYRPMQRLTYTLEYWAFVFRPTPYHVTSVLCHLAAAIALFAFSCELLRFLGNADRSRKWISLLAALVWAIHPVHTSAVIYISGRADPLAAAFGFLGLFCGLRSLRALKAGAWLWMVGAAAAFLLSVLSKEIGLIFPLLWLVLLGMRRHRIAFRNAAVATIFVITIYLSLRLPAEHIAPPAPTAATPLLVRPIVVARAVAEYAGLLILPWNLHMERDVESRPLGFNDTSITQGSWRELQTLLGIILIAVGIYWMARVRKNPALSACLILGVVSYLPVSGIIPLNASVAEHWLYVPSAFLFLAVCLTAAAILEAKPEGSKGRAKRVILVGAAVWMLFLAGRTFVRTFDWKDQRTFLTQTIAKGGASVRMLISLAGLELSQGQLDAAKTHLETALHQQPGQPMALINLAAVAIKQNDFKFAHEILGHARQIPLVEAEANDLLAVLAYRESGKVDWLRLRLAARTGPSNWAIERRYIRTLDDAGEPDRAIAEIKMCLRTQWYRAESWQLLSEILGKAGRAEEAAQAHAVAEKYDVHLGRHTDL
jgi:cytochrome c-type biogenesis protein CcmH/NrfG